MSRQRSNVGAAIEEVWSHQLFKMRTTMCEMLRDRKYEITPHPSVALDITRAKFMRLGKKKKIDALTLEGKRTDPETLVTETIVTLYRLELNETALQTFFSVMDKVH